MSRYSEVLAPFMALMEQELRANAGKGDRPGWLAMTPGDCMLEIYYHASKLQKAVKDANLDGVKEFGADVANLAMMMLDIHGLLALQRPVEQVEVASMQATIEALEKAHAGDGALDFMGYAAQLLRQFQAQNYGEQSQVGPIALPAYSRTIKHNSHDWDEGHMEGWAECFEEFTKLGPLYTRPAPAVQGEPVALVEVGADRNARVTVTDQDWLRGLKDKASHQVVRLYTSPAPADPGEVERLREGRKLLLDDLDRRDATVAELRAELEKVKANSKHLAELDDAFIKGQSEKLRAMTAQLAEAHALLRDALDNGELGRDDVYEAIHDYLEGREDLPASAEPVAPASFQQQVQPWLTECFGAMIAGDREERNHRFLEEALELVQSLGCSAAEAHQLVEYVYGRPVGEPSQEVGGVMVTLAALCLANELDMHQLADTELARVWTKVDQIREKQKSKPQVGPLPGVYPGRETSAPVERDERADFDAWFRKEKGLHPEADTTFIDSAFLPYRAWKARAALERKP